MEFSRFLGVEELIWGHLPLKAPPSRGYAPAVKMNKARGPTVDVSPRPAVDRPNALPFNGEQDDEPDGDESKRVRREQKALADAR